MDKTFGLASIRGFGAKLRYLRFQTWMTRNVDIVGEGHHIGSMETGG